jgi:hypothetical protein
MTNYNVSVGDTLPINDNGNMGFQSAEDVVMHLFTPFIKNVFRIEDVKSIDVARYNSVAVVYKVDEQEEIIGWGDHERFITTTVMADVWTLKDIGAQLINSLIQETKINRFGGSFIGKDYVLWVKLLEYEKQEEERNAINIVFTFEVKRYRRV